MDKFWAIVCFKSNQIQRVWMDSDRASIILKKPDVSHIYRISHNQYAQLSETDMVVWVDMPETKYEDAK